MIRSKVALVSSVVILGICMYLYFPFPNNVMLEAHYAFHVVSNTQSGWICSLWYNWIHFVYNRHDFTCHWHKEISLSDNCNSCNRICNFAQSSNHNVPRNVCKRHYSHFI